MKLQNTSIEEVQYCIIYNMDFTRESYHSHNVLQKSVNEYVEVTVKGEIDVAKVYHIIMILLYI